ncbi:MAG: DNA-3-methyladenine glycosylase [Anaerolineae bacterium]|nr:DNA-3-methyladenine glycosylase [Anaerolineae bacterium]
MNLPYEFYARDTRLVARALLGQRLVCHATDGTRLAGTISETEAYCPNDSASHAYRGKTMRNSAMFLSAGHVYVYFIYGMHFCLNVVTDAENVGAAVLIRAVLPQEGIEMMQARQPKLKPAALCNGPGRLCKAFGIDRSYNTRSLLGPANGIWIEQADAIPDEQVRCTPRIGISGDDTAKNAAWRWLIVTPRQANDYQKAI